MLLTSSLLACATKEVDVDVPPVTPAPTHDVEVNELPTKVGETRVEKRKSARFIFDWIFGGVKK
jgi:hypothetical protein